jgi:hypothetical protein
VAYYSDGAVYSTSSGVTISQNQAARWGGGLYAGWSVPSEFAGTVAHLDNANITLNQASLAAIGVTLFPSQVATEQASYDGCGVSGCVWNADLSFQGTILTGFPNSTDIGIYQLYSTPFSGTPAYTGGSLASNFLVQSPR